MTITNTKTMCPPTAKQAVILTGGRGTRMLPLTRTVPKPMIPFWGKPFLQHLIELLRENGIREVIMLVGYLHEHIEEYFGDGRKFGVSITYSYSPSPTDTGTRLRSAYPLTKQTFLLLYGDNYWPLRLTELTQYYESIGRKAVVTVYHNRDGATKNNMRVENGLVAAYDRKRQQKGLNGVDIGFYILDKDVLYDLPRDNFSFEEVIVPRLISEGQLTGFLTEHKYYGLSTPERIPATQEYLRPKKTIFLDRDGVINKRPPKAEYISNWSEFVFLPKVREALILLAQKGYDIYIVTNQAGIAQGKVTRKQVDDIHNRLVAEVKGIGVAIADIAICPHGWDQGCFCRKPNPGLLFDLSYKHHINLFSSVFVGDDPRDMFAGNRAGCQTILVGNASDASYKSLYEAAITV